MNTTDLQTKAELILGMTDNGRELQYGHYQLCHEVLRGSFISESEVEILQQVCEEWKEKKTLPV